MQNPTSVSFFFFPFLSFLSFGGVRRQARGKKLLREKGCVCIRSKLNSIVQKNGARIWGLPGRRNHGECNFSDLIFLVLGLRVLLSEKRDRSKKVLESGFLLALLFPGCVFPLFSVK